VKIQSKKYTEQWSEYVTMYTDANHAPVDMKLGVLKVILLLLLLLLLITITTITITTITTITITSITTLTTNIGNTREADNNISKFYIILYIYCDKS